MADQVTINVTDTIPPPNIATIDKDGLVGNAVSKAQFQTQFDDFKEDLETEVSRIATSAVKGEATPTSSPTPYNATDYPKGLYEKWEVKTAGTYTNFKDASNAAIVVSSSDLTAGLVYINVTNGVSKKEVIAIPTPAPTGVVAENNAQSVSGGEVFNKTVLKSGLEITNVENSKNLLNPAYIKNDRIVISSGAVGSNVGSVAVEGLPINGLTEISVSKYVYKSNYFWSFMNDANVILSHGVVESDLEMTLTIPSGATKFNMLLKHSSQTHAVPNVMINVGAEILPYEPWTPPVGYLGKINGNKIAAFTLANDNKIPDAITDDNAVNLRKMKEYVAEHAGSGGGGQAYDQSLNTTDNVTFATVTSGNLTVGSITTNLLIANLKTGAGTPPTAAVTGEAWIDTAAGNTIKVK